MLKNFVYLNLGMTIWLQVRRIILHQDEHGTLRVVDVATEREVKKMLDSQIVQRSEVGDTMVVQIQQPASEVERHVIQIQQPDNVVEQQVLEIEQPDHQEEQVVHVENDGQTAEQVHMGLDARKPVFGGLRTTQAQTSLCIRTVWSATLLLVFFWKYHM